MGGRGQWRIGKDGEPVRLSRIEAKLFDGALSGESALAAARWVADKKQRREQAEQAAAVAEDAADDRAGDRLELQRQRLERVAAENDAAYRKYLFDKINRPSPPPIAGFPF